MGNNGFKPPYKLLLLLPISHFDASDFFLSGQVVKTHAQTAALWGGTAAAPPVLPGDLQQGRAPLPWASRLAKSFREGSRSRAVEAILKWSSKYWHPGCAHKTEAVNPDKEPLICRIVPGCSGPWLVHTLSTCNAAISHCDHTITCLHKHILAHQAPSFSMAFKTRNDDMAFHMVPAHSLGAPQSGSSATSLGWHQASHYITLDLSFPIFEGQGWSWLA